MPVQNEISFGQFRLDLTNECLWRGAHSISLRPKAFAVLKLLINHPGQLVNKQAVLETVWPGTFVGDAVLKDNIRQLREALHDDASAPTYIETSHRRGYRFIGRISVSMAVGSAAPQPSASLPPSDNTAPTSTRPPQPLGRSAELHRLQMWLENVAQGERRTIFVTGEPGIGKTTIVQAFLKEAALMPNVRTAYGQCLEHYGAGEAYLPVLEAFSRLCRSRDGAAILDCMRQHAPAWLAQMPSVLPAADRSNLLALSAGATRERMLREMAELIENLTAASPLVLVLEDLHWSDYSTMDLISYLARRHDSARLLVIGTYRPVDLILRDHPLKGVKRELQAHGLCHELALEYLSQATVDEYLAARFRGNRFPARLRRVVHARTEGNPLFMVNLVEYLIDQKMIVEDRGGWELQVDLSQVEQGVPANLRQLIEKQVERLSPGERTVLEAASVAGMECSSVAIAAGLDMPMEWVEQHCEELARRHQFLSPAWLVELPDGTVTPRRRFIHVLYLEVPYRLMPPMRRAEIHQRIAERGVAIYGERCGEIAAELAMHFEQSRDWPRAVQYLLQAATNGARKSAHHEAAELAKHGLTVLKLVPASTARDQQEADLRMTLILSLMAVKGFAWAGVGKIYDEGKELFRQNKPSAQLFNWLYLKGLLSMFRGNIRPALEIADQVIALAEELQQPQLIMEAQRARGSTLLEMGRCSEALEHVNRASDMYSANRHPKTLISGRDCKVLSECSAGKALWALGFPDAAMQRVQAGVEFAKHIAHPQSLAYAAHFATQMHQLRGEPLLARERAIEGIKIAEEYYLELWAAFGNIALGWAEAELGNTQQGIERMQSGLASYEATETKIFYPTFLGSLADQLNKAHRIEEGLGVISRALSCAEMTGEGYTLPELLRIKGELLIKSCDPKHRLQGHLQSSVLSEARACFTQALAVSKQQGTKSWELRALLGMHRVEQICGESSLMQLAETYSWFSEGFQTRDLLEAKAILDNSVSNQCPINM